MTTRKLGRREGRSSRPVRPSRVIAPSSSAGPAARGDSALRPALRLAERPLSGAAGLSAGRLIRRV